MTNLSFRIPAKLMQEFRKITDKRAINRSALIRNWIEEYVKKAQKKD